MSGSNISKYGSHLSVLIQAVWNTTGSIVELGAGQCSTLMLHALCNTRKIVTLESDAEWLEKFAYLSSPIHQFIHVEPTIEAWIDAVHGIDRSDIGVALIDQFPPKARNPTAEILAPTSQVVVFHDAWPGSRYLPLSSMLRVTNKYIRKFTARKPYTFALSNTIDVFQWKDI